MFVKDSLPDGRPSVKEERGNDGVDQDEILADLSCLFEGNHPTTLKRFVWNAPSENSSEDICVESSASQPLPIQVALHVLDDDPGALQSGHYLWPASLALCDYLINRYGRSKIFKNGHDNDEILPTTIVELGAGCGLASLVALQIFAATLEIVAVTDHDASTLKLAEKSYESTFDFLHESYVLAKGSTSQEEARFDQLKSIRFESLSVEWGDQRDTENVISMINPDGKYDSENVCSKLRKEDHSALFQNTSRATWILGTDLIYCADVVGPLIRTASNLLHNDGDGQGKFFLSQSFEYDEETEAAIVDAAKLLHLKRKILVDNLNGANPACSEVSGIRIQVFYLDL